MNSSNAQSGALEESWFAAVMQLRPPQRKNHDARRFCELMELAAHTRDQRVIQCLFESLTDVDTGGVLQSVYGVLGTTHIQDYYSALFAVMPSLLDRAPHAACQCLDFPGRDLSPDEIREILEMARRSLSRATISTLISTMRENGMSGSENHEAVFGCLVEHVEKFHGN